MKHKFNRLGVGITVIAVILASVLLLEGCKKDENEPQGNLPPVISKIRFDPPLISWNNTCQICVDVYDPEGKDLTFSWSCEEGEFITSTEYPCVTWRSPIESGTYTHTIHINDSSQVLNRDITIDVLEPPFRFTDNFSYGLGNWGFRSCNTMVIEEQLFMHSSSYQECPRALSYSFFPYGELPWGVSFELGLEDHEKEDPGGHGVSLHLCDDGNFAITDIGLFIETGYSQTNWSWRMRIPSLGGGYLPYDQSCYGQTEYLLDKPELNHLEMWLDEDKKATIRINGHVLLEEHSGISEMESALGFGVNAGIVNIALYGNPGSTTIWDNIVLYATGDKKQSTPQLNNSHPVYDKVPFTPLEMKNGEVVTIKSLMREKGLID